MVSLNDTQHNKARVSLGSGHVLFTVMLNFIMLSVVMLYVVMLSVIMLNVILLSMLTISILWIVLNSMCWW